MIDQTVYPYTVLILPRERSHVKKLFAQLLRRPNLLPLMVRPLCPECAGVVQTWNPRIRQGDEFYDGLVTWKNPDELIGFTLLPCEHSIKQLVFVQATT